MPTATGTVRCAAQVPEQRLCRHNRDDRPVTRQAEQGIGGDKAQDSVAQENPFSATPGAKLKASFLPQSLLQTLSNLPFPSHHAPGAPCARTPTSRPSPWCR